MSNEFNFELMDASTAPPSLRDEGYEASDFEALHGVSIPKVSIRTTGIQIIDGGEVLIEAPAGSSIPLVVVGASPIGFSCFPPYSKGDSAPPICRSYDGIRPDAIVENPISPICKTCPMRAKGSAKDSAGGIACRQRMNLAVISPSHPEKVLRLGLSPTAIFGNREVETPQGYYAFKPLNISCDDKKRFIMEFILDVKHNPKAEQLQVIFRPLSWTKNQAGLMEQVKEHRENTELLDIIYGRHESLGSVEGEVFAGIGAPPSETPAQTTQAPQARVPRGTSDLPYTPYEPHEVEQTKDTYWQTKYKVDHGNGLVTHKVILVPKNTLLPNDDWGEVDHASFVAYDEQVKHAQNKAKQEPAVRTRQPRGASITPPPVKDSAPQNEEAGVVQGKGQQALTNSIDALLGEDDDE